MNLKISCIQMNSGDDLALNIEAAEALIREAHGKGVEFMLLPENAFLMQDPAIKQRLVFAEQEHAALSRMCALAAELNIWLLIGSLAVSSHTAGKSFNRSYLINAEGNIAARYDKIHLFDVTLKDGESYRESDHMEPGCAMVLAQTPWGGLGLTICYDVRFPHLHRALAKSGAAMLAVPAAFTKTTGEAHWHVLNRARAIETGCFVLAPAQCGTHPGGRKTYGHSLIIDPWGNILAEGGYTPGVILAEIDLTKVKEARAMIPAWSHEISFQR